MKLRAAVLASDALTAAAKDSKPSEKSAAGPMVEAAPFQKVRKRCTPDGRNYQYAKRNWKNWNEKKRFFTCLTIYAVFPIFHALWMRSRVKATPSNFDYLFPSPADA